MGGVSTSEGFGDTAPKDEIAPEDIPANPGIFPPLKVANFSLDVAASPPGTHTLNYFCFDRN
jgi:hypothetical protein